MTEYLREAFSLEGLTALVTGSNRGIGYAIAGALESAGATVHRHVRKTAESASESEQNLERVWECDLSDPTAVEGFAKQFNEKVDLDVLVNNAGVEMPAYLPNVTDDLMWETFQVNVNAPIQLARYFAPKLQASKNGSLINISSIHEEVPFPANLPYAASKSALHQVTRTLAVELGPSGVRVNAIAPGVIATDINAAVIDEIGHQNFADWIPLGRVGQAAEVADAAVFLASNAARYVLGTTLTIDGGYSQNLIRYRQEID